MKCLRGEEFPERGSNFLNYVHCPIVLNYIQSIFPRRAKNFPVPPICGHAYLGDNYAPVPTPSSPDQDISAISAKIPLHKGKR